MDVNTVLEILMGIIVAGLGWWNTKQASYIDELRSDVTDVKVNYVHKDDLRIIRESIDKRFDRMEDIIVNAIRGNHDHQRNN